jgi:hypothetical protein
MLTSPPCIADFLLPFVLIYRRRALTALSGSRRAVTLLQVQPLGQQQPLQQQLLLPQLLQLSLLLALPNLQLLQVMAQPPPQQLLPQVAV